MYAEHLLRAHLDAPVLWLDEKHKKVLRNSACSRNVRSLKLQRHVIMDDAMRTSFEGDKRFQNFVAGELFHALNGVAYVTYGKEEVRRLLLTIWRIDEITAYLQDA